MKEVKIYTIVSDQLSPPITGESFCTDMVRHSDYAELEDKYAALAEDNYKAMESLKQADAVVKLAHEKFSALAAENETLNKFIAASCFVQAGEELAWYPAIDHAPETPATDAFLAEVRAQGVEMFAERKNNEMMSLHPDTHAVGSIAAEMSSQVKQLREFAAQLRKGAAL